MKLKIVAGKNNRNVKDIKYHQDNVAILRRNIEKIAKETNTEIILQFDGFVRIKGQPDAIKEAESKISRVITPNQIGDTFQATILRVEDFALYVKVKGSRRQEEKVHLSGLKNKNPREYYKIGDPITVVIKDFDGHYPLLGEAETQIESSAEPVKASNKVKKTTVDHPIKGKENQKRIIGYYGDTVKKIQEQTGTEIVVRDGVARIKGTADNIKAAQQIISAILTPIQVGMIYKAEVLNAVDFGVFAMLPSWDEGMAHWNDNLIKPPREYKTGDIINVTVLEVTKHGSIRLKEVEEPKEEDVIITKDIEIGFNEDLVTGFRGKKTALIQARTNTEIIVRNGFARIIGFEANIKEAEQLIMAAQTPIYSNQTYQARVTLVLELGFFAELPNLEVGLVQTHRTLGKKIDQKVGDTVNVRIFNVDRNGYSLEEVEKE